VPFPGASTLRKLDEHRTREPEPVRQLRPEVPAELAAVLAKMMAKAPGDRYQTAAEVAEALEPFTTDTETEGQESKKRKKRWLIAAMILGVGLLIAGAVYRVQTDRGELVITTESDDVEVVIKQGGKEVRIIDTKTKKRITLRSGEYELELNGGEGLKLDIDRVTLRRGETVLARIERVAAKEKAGEVRRIHWQGRYLYFTTFSPDSRYYLATGDAQEGRDLTLRVWEVASGKQVLECVGNECAAFTPDSKQVLVAGPDKALHLWDIATGKEVRSFEGHTSWIIGVDISRDGKRALSTSVDATVRIWDLDTGKELGQLTEQPPWKYARFAPDGKSFLTCALAQADHTIRLWETATRKELQSWKQAEPVFRCQFEPDSRRFLTVGQGESLTARWWEMDREKSVKEVSIGAANLTDLSLGISRDCRRLIYAHKGSAKVVVLDLSDGKKQTRFEVPDPPFGNVGMSFSPNGRYACGCTMSGRVYLWQLPDLPAASRASEQKP
jgi:hypothetical protein